MTTRTLAIGTTSLALALVCGGCASVHNQRLVDGPEGAPTTNAPPAIWPAEAMAPATSASTTTVSRDHWSEVTIVAVNDGVEHQENFTRYWPVIDQSTARARGEYPTVESSVETGGDPGAQVLEGFAWPVAIGADIVMALPRLFHQVNQSPTQHYQRELTPTAPAPATAASPE